MLYLPFPTLVSPGAEAETSLSEIPAKEIDIVNNSIYYIHFIRRNRRRIGSWNNHILPSNFKGIVFPSSKK
jgi:hypothetical protein